jgi:hypothetical protein
MFLSDRHAIFSHITIKYDEDAERNVHSNMEHEEVQKSNNIWN